MSTAEEHYQQAAALLAKVYTSDSTADEDPLTVATVAQVHAVLAVATVLNDILTRMPEPTRNIRVNSTPPSVWDRARGRCRSCGASILWCTTDGGKSMPVDAEPAAFGNVFVEPDASGRGLLARVSSAPTLEDDDGPRYLSHHVTCPKADLHRKSGVQR